MTQTTLDDIKEIIQIPSSHRNKSQLKSLSNYMSNLSFFKNHIVPVGEEIVLKSCEYIQYEFFPCDSFIFSIGDPGDKFYVIIQGQVRVLAFSAESETLEEISTLVEGSSFGEYALLYNQPRMASIQCTVDTHLAVLSKQSYLQILGKVDNKRIDETVLFLKNFPLFKNWTKGALVKISYFFSEMSLHRKVTLFQEGDQIKKVFFIKSGELELLKTVKEEVKNATKTKVCKRIVQVSLLSVGEIVGEEVLNLESYLYTCKVSSLQASVLVISKEDFISKIKSEESQSIVKGNYECKQKERVLRIDSLKALKSIYKELDEDESVVRPVVKFIYRSPKVFVDTEKKRKVDFGIPKSLSRMEISMKRSGLSCDRSQFWNSPLNKHSKHGFLFKRYEHPIRIEKKKLSERFRLIEDSSRNFLRNF